ncbi:MAG: type IX secretion system membrane protein PorP/SprF [Cytophagaceae bacterium]
MRKYLIILFQIMVIQAFGQIHRPLFDQYLFNPLVINPGYAGSNEALTAVMHHRSQWSGFDGAPVNQTFAIHSPIGTQNANAGSIISLDRFGLSSRIDLMGVFAYRIPVGKGRLSLGLQGGVEYLSTAWDRVSTDPNYQDDYVFQNNQPNLFTPRVGSGLYYDNKKFFIGIAMPDHIIYNQSFYKRPGNLQFGRMYNFYTGYHIKLSESFRLVPSLLLKHLKGSSMQMDLNSMVSYKRLFSFGVSYRTNQSIIALFEVRKDQVSFGYAYDHWFNEFANVRLNAHEFMLR